MYIDRNTIQGDMANKYYVFKEELKALCCSKIFKPGEIIMVQVYTSKNRLLVVNKRSELHKVKRSSLNRTTGEYNGDFNKK
jgi:hypothetical protein